MQFTLKDFGDGEVEVHCRQCGELLDTVATAQTAYYRAGSYLSHVCKPVKP